MGRLEEDLVASMIALRRSDPDCDRHMFVVRVGPSSIAALETALPNACVRTESVREDDVLMVCRPEERGA